MDQIQPEIDESRIILLKIIEQAIRDFLSLEYASAPIEKLYFRTAYGFIFEDKYEINYGGNVYTSLELIHAVNIDHHWLRRKVIQLRTQRNK